MFCCIYAGPVIDLSSTGSLTLHHTGTCAHITKCRVLILDALLMFQLLNLSGLSPRVSLSGEKWLS